MTRSSERERDDGPHLGGHPRFSICHAVSGQRDEALRCQHARLDALLWPGSGPRGGQTYERLPSFTNWFRRRGGRGVCAGRERGQQGGGRLRLALLDQHPRPAHRHRLRLQPTGSSRLLAHDDEEDGGDGARESIDDLVQFSTIHGSVELSR